MEINLDLEAFYLEEETPEPEVYKTSSREDPFAEIKRQCRELSRDMEAWRADAPCVGKYQWSTGNKTKISEKTFINTICSECSFKAECLLVAVCYRDEHLVWGGATPDERDKLIKDILLKEDDPDLFRFWRRDYLNVVRNHIDNFYADRAEEAKASSI